MIFHPAYDFPFEVLRDCDVHITEKELESLARCSRDVAIITWRGDILGVIGLAKIGLLASEGYVWFMQRKGLRPTVSMAKAARGAFDEWLEGLQDTPIIMTERGFSAGDRLIRFFNWVRYKDTLLHYYYRKGA